MSTLDTLISHAKSDFDLTSPGDQKSLLALAEQLLELKDLSAEDLSKHARSAAAPLEFRLAAKLVQSRQWMLRNTHPLRVAVIFAMWGEHHRLLPKDSENPHGEDSLRTKLSQLEWVTADTPVDWKLFAIDDGCPHGSADIAKSIAEAHSLKSKVSVNKLSSVLPANSGPLAALASVNDSRKAGAIILGCQMAMDQGFDAIVYTDADNSVHLGQLGILLQPHIDDKSEVVLGDRKHPDAVLVKQEARWGVGIVLLRHMQRMIGEAIFSRGITDTQAAFKLYGSLVLKGILERPTVYDFSFDSDWILSALAQGVDPVQVPFAFIDSAAESASIEQGPMTTWESLLKGLLASVRRHGVPHNKEMAQILDEEIKSAQDLERLINTLPPQLENADPKELGDPDLMSPEEIRAWIRSH